MVRGRVKAAGLAGLLSAALAVGCGGDAGEQQEMPDMEESPAAAPSLDGSAPEGAYALVSVGGGQLPAVLEQTGDCRVEVVDGSLRMEAGRFAFQNNTREVCAGAEPGANVMHAAGGSYAMQGGAVVLTADVGDAFDQARGSLDEAGLTLEEMSTEAGPETVSWRLDREEALVQRTDSAGTS